MVIKSLKAAGVVLGVVILIWLAFQLVEPVPVDSSPREIKVVSS